MAQEVTRAARREVERPYDGGEETRDRPLYRPWADIYETDDSVVVMADMPGVGPNDIEITLERNVLTLRGRTPGVAHAGYRQVYAEYEEGNYERVFTVSEDIDREGIKASQKGGVLTVELPKAPPAKARKIEVKST